ncbi:hypothetical protein BH24ACT1_BH24ACT1_04850 [soil metagenome]
MDEQGYEQLRTVAPIIVSAVARVEVPSGLWRKLRMGDISPETATALVADFEDDFLGASDSGPRFEVVGVTATLLSVAARLTGTVGLRAYDAVQLATAEAARTADPGCDTFACFDSSLRDAAARSGFALYPRE